MELELKYFAWRRPRRHTYLEVLIKLQIKDRHPRLDNHPQGVEEDHRVPERFAAGCHCLQKTQPGDMQTQRPPTQVLSPQS